MSRTGKAVGSTDRCSGVCTTDRQTDRRTDTRTDRQTDRRTDTRTDRQTDTLTDRQTLEVPGQHLWLTTKLLLDWHMLVHKQLT